MKKIILIILLFAPFLVLTSFDAVKNTSYVGVTEIAAINNQTSENVYFVNIENSRDNVTLAKNKAQNIACWIPWADNKEQFDAHHLEFKVVAKSVIYYVWQSNGRVRYSTDGWHDNGQSVPGNSEEDGKRTVTITLDNIEFDRYR